MCWFMGSQRVEHDWVTELNWTELNLKGSFSLKISKANTKHLQAKKFISICLSKAAFQEYFGGRNQIQSCPSPFLTKPIYLTNCNPILENLDHAKLFSIFHNFFFLSFFLILKTHFLLSFSNQELTFILAFYRLVSINTSDNF